MTQHHQAGEGPSRAPFVLHVVWRLGCVAAPSIAEELRRHFASDRYHQIAGGAGLTVLLRDADGPESTAPPTIDWTAGQIVAVVALVDQAFATDSHWAAYLNDLARQADERGFATRLFPVALDAALANQEVQALRWYCWPEGDRAGGRIRRLIRELTLEFTRMLRHWLADGRHSQENELQRYRENIQVFLSHSKHGKKGGGVSQSEHDEGGEAVAKAIRDWLHNHSALASFLDVYDMPGGVRFDAAIEDAIKHGVLVAIYTDSYSSREWCRREALLAKRHGVSMIVVDCLREKDDRAFPYLWNVPVIRMDVNQPERVELVAAALLDEVFKDYLWQQRIDAYRRSASRTVFIPRPPELTTAAFTEGVKDGEWAFVHPEPPLGQEELHLFANILPNVQVCSLNEWLAGERR